MAKLELRKKKNTKGKIMTGMNTELYIDWIKIPYVKSVNFSLDARGVATADIEVFVSELVTGENQVKAKVKKVKNG